MAPYVQCIDVYLIVLNVVARNTTRMLYTACNDPSINTHDLVTGTVIPPTVYT